MIYLNQIIEWLHINALNLGIALAILLAVVWGFADMGIKFAKLTEDKEDDKKAELRKKRIMIFIDFFPSVIRNFVKLKDKLFSKKNNKGFVNALSLEVIGMIVIGFVLGLFLSNFLLPVKVETVKDESMKVEYEALKSAYAEEVAENQRLKSEQIVKSRVVIKNADGSSREEEHSDSKSLEYDIYMSKAKISNQEQQISYLQSQLHEYRKESRTPWGVRAMGDFNKDNKYQGYRAGGHVGMFAADAVFRDNKYDGYSIGLQYNN